MNNLFQDGTKDHRNKDDVELLENFLGSKYRILHNLTTVDVVIECEKILKK